MKADNIISSDIKVINVIQGVPYSLPCQCGYKLHDLIGQQFLGIHYIHLDVVICFKL